MRGKGIGAGTFGCCVGKGTREEKEGSDFAFYRIERKETRLGRVWMSVRKWKKGEENGS